MLLAIRMRCLTSRNDLINIAVSDQPRRGRTVGDPHVTALNREVNRSNTMLCTTSVPLTPPYWFDTPPNESVAADRKLVLEDQFQELSMRQAMAGRFLKTHLQGLRQSGQAKFFQYVPKSLVHQ